MTQDRCPIGAKLNALKRAKFSVQTKALTVGTAVMQVKIAQELISVQVITLELHSSLKLLLALTKMHVNKRISTRNMMEQN